jgi:hypothetical protein
MPEYVVTTKLGMVPHVIDMTPFPSLNRTLKIYMDDILYKDSFYDRATDVPIKEFCSTDRKVAISFRKSPRTLISRRGHYKLDREKYMQVVRILDPDYCADFETGRVFIDGKELIEPPDLGSFVKGLREEGKIFGTQFINNMVDEGRMLSFDGCRIEARDIYDCGCCGGLSEGYLRHLWSIKEMNASSYLAIHNYNMLQKIMEAVEDKSLTLCLV